MTQEYINHLSENYDVAQVPEFYFTTDGTAFGKLPDALRHAARLEDATVKVVPHGGKESEARVVGEPEVGVPIRVEAVAEANEGGAADIDLKKLKREQLAELCTQRSIVFGEKATKAELIRLLESQKGEQASEGEPSTDSEQASEGE